MTRFLVRFFAVASIASALGACVTLQQSAPRVATAKDVALDRFVSEHRRRARKLEANGSLAAALREWRYVSAAAPGDNTAHRKITRLERIIADRAEAYLGRADAAWRRNRRREAHLLYLKVLALDGTNRRALERLREQERAVIMAGQARKDDAALAEYRAHMSRHQAQERKKAAASKRPHYRKASTAAKTRRNAGPKNHTSKSGVLREKIALARQIQARGDFRLALKKLESASDMPGAKEAGVGKMVTQLRKKIAAQLYAEGVKQMSSDINRAVELLTEAVRFDPEHLGAHRRLAQAKRMRDSLNSMK